jgi:hypothetical protein
MQIKRPSKIGRLKPMADPPEFLRMIDWIGSRSIEFHRQRRACRVKLAVRAGLQIVVVPTILSLIAWRIRVIWPGPPPTMRLPTIGVGAAALFALAGSCISGGVWGGAVAMITTFAILAWEIRDLSRADLAAWLWWGTGLLAYGSVLIVLYFRAPAAGPPFLPPPGATRLRRLSRRWRRRPRDPSPQDSRNGTPPGRFMARRSA